MTRFLGTAIPGTNYIASAGRMATAHAQNSKLRKIALDLAKDQTSVANSLAAWVNVSGPVVTRQNPYAAAGGGATRVTAPRLLPDQVSLLQQLSQLRGQNFDSLYVSSVKETLAQLQTLFRDFGEGGGDAGLRAIAKWELPNWRKRFRRSTRCEPVCRHTSRQSTALERAASKAGTGENCNRNPRVPGIKVPVRDFG
jgi:predicted outer membrane protein